MLISVWRLRLVLGKLDKSLERQENRRSCWRFLGQDILILVEWPGIDTLFLSRLLGVDPLKPSLDWVGMKIRAKFRRLSKFKPTDVYFVPA
jgi:hypothetical protein